MYPEGYEPRLWLAKKCLELGGIDTIDYDLPHITGEWFKDRDDLPEWVVKSNPGFVLNGIPIIWLMDNRMPYLEWQNDMARYAKERTNAMLLCMQKADAIKQGFKWLPLAATPGYKPIENADPPSYDIGFVGGLSEHDPRTMLLQRLQQDYSCNFQSGVFDEKAIDVYHSARIGVNATAHYGSQFAYDINMRVFEIPACNRLLVTPRVPGMTSLGFRNGVNCLMYQDGVELLYALDIALANENMRNELAEAGHLLVMEKHTYKQRAEQLLGWLKDG